jgi:hypothetical protein
MERTLVGSNEGAKPPRLPVIAKSDLFFIPVKHSQVAGLAAGWLAVALSMAAIGTAAVGHVGVDTSVAQAQATVRKPVTVGIPSAPLATTQTPQSHAPAPSVSASEPSMRTAALAQYVKPAAAATTSTSTPARVQVLVTAPQPTPASTSATVSSVVKVPQSEVLVPEDVSTATTPTTATPTKVKATKKPASRKTTTTDQIKASGSLEAVSVSASRNRQGAISAGCKDGRPSFSTAR